MMRLLSAFCLLVGVCLAESAAAAETAASVEPLPGTQPLSWTDDLASRLVDGVDRFLLRKLEASIGERAKHWQRDFSSPEAFQKSIEPNRKRLAHILGVRDERLAGDGPDIIAAPGQPTEVGRGPGYKIFAVRWPVMRLIHGEGLLLIPDGKPPAARVVAVPDADQTPEMICGLTDGVPVASQYARRLAENGCLVLVPMLINRELQARHGRATVTNREFLYRSAFELGRHLIGYELQKVLAGVDWFVKEAGQTPAKIGVIGWGEGGMLALYAAALDPRIDAVCVSGHFDSRQDIWQQPLDRNVFGLLEQFGDAELASLIAPRPLIVEACRGPELELPSKGGAPARLVTPPLASVQAEVARAEESAHIRIDLIAVDGGHGPFGSDQALQRLLQALGLNLGPAAPGALERLRTAFDPAPRQNRQIQEIDDHNQWLLVESP